MSYDEAVSYVLDSYGPGRKHSSDTVRAVLGALGNPQENLRVIHVAGTNGKGSVCAMISSVLTAAGYKTGFFSSPHLKTFKERFRINNEEISDENFAKYASHVKNASKTVFGNDTDMLSYFELLTVMMFAYFSEQKTDFAVVEVGIGGRLDATNVISSPALSVITSVSIDHTEYLGDTIEEIASEKAGILKKNCPAVLYYQAESVYNVVAEAARKIGASLVYDTDIRTAVAEETYKGICFSIKSKMLDYENIRIRLSGDYQLKNTHTAIIALKTLSEREGIVITEKNIYEGLYDTTWAGRFETVSEKPTIILDGAHNIDAVTTLCSSIRKYFHSKRITLVIGILKDKEYAGMLAELTQLSGNIVLTKPSYDFRAAAPSELYRHIPDKQKIIVTEADYKRALYTARRLTPDDGVIIVAGSLYLIGDVRTYLSDSCG